MKTWYAFHVTIASPNLSLDYIEEFPGISLADAWLSAWLNWRESAWEFMTINPA